METIKQTIKRIEDYLRQNNIPISKLLKISKINKSTYYRWRNSDNGASHSKWMKLVVAFEKIESENQKIS